LVEGRDAELIGMDRKEFYTYRAKFAQKTQEVDLQTQDFTNIDEYLDSLAKPREDRKSATD